MELVKQTVQLLWEFDSQHHVSMGQGWQLAARVSIQLSDRHVDANNVPQTASRSD